MVKLLCIIILMFLSSLQEHVCLLKIALPFHQEVSRIATLAQQSHFDQRVSLNVNRHAN